MYISTGDLYAHGNMACIEIDSNILRCGRLVLQYTLHGLSCGFDVDERVGNVIGISHKQLQLLRIQTFQYYHIHV